MSRVNMAGCSSHEFRAVIFDFDGTLVNSLNAYHVAFNHGTSLLGLPKVDKEKLAGMLSMGKGLRQVLLELFPQLREDQVQLCAGNIRKFFYDIQREQTYLLPGSLEVLSWLSDRGFGVAIATSRAVENEEMKKSLTFYGIENYVNVVVTAHGAVPRKPAPDQLLEVLRIFNLPSRSCIYVGDSIVDVRAGKAAGIQTVAVASGVEKREVLEKETPDHIIDELPELIRIIESMNSGTSGL